MRDQMSGQVNVEVDAVPQQDLSKVMTDMRDYYESITTKNKKDLENWYQTKVGGGARREPHTCWRCVPETTSFCPPARRRV